AFFLLRRHSNVYLDISGIPPKSLLEYFPRLHEVAHKTLFGTDWPGPGVPDVGTNLEEFRKLPLSAEAQQRILSGTALEIWPAYLRNRLARLPEIAKIHSSIPRKSVSKMATFSSIRPQSMMAEFDNWYE